MGSIVHYVLSARTSFAQTPPCREDALVFSCLAYLRFPEEVAVRTPEGVSLAELNDTRVRSRLVAALHDVQGSSMLVQACAASPRFSGVRACLHESDASVEEGRQFSATTFVLPDAAGSFVAFRGTDDTVLGWKENLGLACAAAVPAQEHALRYLEQVASSLEGTLLAGGHSKGGALAVYACGHASDEVRSRIACCYSLDGPGLNEQARKYWQTDVPIDKSIPSASLVGMLFETSQDSFTVVRSTAEGVLQHDPFTWEVRDGSFATAKGMDYDAWRLARRLNDWLEAMDVRERTSFVELLSWLVDATGETSFSGLLARWKSNTQAMQAALDAGPAGDRELFARVMEDLVATVALGSAQEYARPEAGTPERADAAARKVNDLSAHVNDHLARIDRYAGL